MAYFKRSGTLGRFFWSQFFDKFSQVCIWFHMRLDMQKKKTPAGAGAAVINQPWP